MTRLSLFVWALLAVAVITVAANSASPTNCGRSRIPAVERTRKLLLGPPSAPAPVASSSMLWSADMETGDLSQWSLPGVPNSANAGGGVFNSGTAWASVDSVSPAHGGLHSAKLSITAHEEPGIPTSGTRLFRWREPKDHPELYYSVWYYFPRRYHPNGDPSWWNVFQWKSKHAKANISNPFFTLNVGNRSDGSMFVYLYDPNAKSSYGQTSKNIPEGRWFRVEAYYKCAGDKSGRVIFWQDGVQIFDIHEVQTRYPDGDCAWSVNNYSNGLDPSVATIYVDDAAICVGTRCP